jgi:hypothetical protein
MIQRCSQCGFRCPTRSFFRRESGGFFGLKKTVCKGCDPYVPTSGDRSRFASTLATFAIWSLIGGYAFRQSRSDGLSFWIMVIAAFATRPLRIAIHEAGHAAIAKFVGREVFSVTIGGGPRLWAYRIGGTLLEVRQYASAGGRMHSFDPQDRYSIPSRAAVILAGPAANALGALAALWLCALLSPPISIPAQIITASLSGFGLAMALMAVVNLIPQSLGDDGTVASDGRQLQQLFHRKPKPNPDLLRLAKISGLTRMNRFEEAAAVALDASDTSELRPIFFAQALHCISRSRGDAAAMACYLARMVNDLPAVEQAGLIDRDPLPWLNANVAWSALKSGDDRFRTLIEPLAGSALDAEPNLPEMKGTWGAWTVDSGHPNEGLPFLIEAIRASDDPIDRADFCTYLAKGLRLVGDDEQAEGFELLKLHLLKSAV